MKTPSRDSPDMILSDDRMSGLNEFILLERLGTEARETPVMMLPGHGDVQHAAPAMRLGVEDLLEKPYNAEHLLPVIRRTLRTRRLMTKSPGCRTN
jgi:two-component system, NtrC family, C4-dicarboxylate transport response regulator DctD